MLQLLADQIRSLHMGPGWLPGPRGRNPSAVVAMNRALLHGSMLRTELDWIVATIHARATVSYYSSRPLPAHLHIE